MTFQHWISTMFTKVLILYTVNPIDLSVNSYNSHMLFAKDLCEYASIQLFILPDWKSQFYSKKHLYSFVSNIKPKICVSYNFQSTFKEFWPSFKDLF